MQDYLYEERPFIEGLFLSLILTSIIRTPYLAQALKRNKYSSYCTASESNISLFEYWKIV